MNKAKLIDQIAKHSDLPKATCKKVLESFIATVGDSLKKGDTVSLTGFATFSVIKRQSRVGVNPSTGQKMQIPAKNVAKFKAGKALRELVA